MSRSSDIVSQLQSRRAERKKPKINAKLKKVSIDASQQGGIAVAQENKPPPITMQKTGGRNSLALTFSIGFHVVIAIFMGIIYIKDRIQHEPDEIIGAFVPPDIAAQKRVILNPKPKHTFEPKQQDLDQLIPKQPIVTDANIPKTPDGLTLPSAGDTNVLEDTGFNAGPRVTDIGRNIKGPVAPIDNNPIPPTVVRPSGQDTPLVDITDVTAPADATDLFVPEIDPSVKGATAPKALKKVKPTYPKNARRAQKEGKVILVATIGTDGIAKNIKAETKLGYGFEEAAIEALKKFKFVPGKKDGKSIELAVRIPFEFKLDDK